MPYAPGVTDQRGQFIGQGIMARGQALGQGISQAGQDLNQGFQDYAKLKQADAATTGQIEGYGASGVSALMPFMTDDNQAKAQKFLDHKANLNDKTMLLGALTQAKALKDDQAKNDMQRQQASFMQQQAAEMQQRVALQKKQEDDSQRSEQLLRSISQPGPSPMAQAIGGGASFEQLQGLSPTQTNPTMADVFSRYIQRGGPMTPEVERFINSGMQAENQRGQIAERGQAASDRTADRTATPQFTTVPGTDYIVASHNGQSFVVNKPVKETATSERLAASKELSQAIKDGRFDDAQAIGMGLGHYNRLTGQPLTAADYQGIALGSQPPQTAQPAAPTTGMAKIRLPSGKVMLIPRQALDQAKGMGATEVP